MKGLVVVEETCARLVSVYTVKETGCVSETVTVARELKDKVVVIQGEFEDWQASLDQQGNIAYSTQID